MFHSRVCSGRKHYATRSAWHWAAPERIWALLAPPWLSQVHQEYWRRRTLGSQLQKYLWEPDKDPEVFPKYLIFNVVGRRPAMMDTTPWPYWIAMAYRSVARTKSNLYSGPDSNTLRRSALSTEWHCVSSCCHTEADLNKRNVPMQCTNIYEHQNVNRLSVKMIRMNW